ncbi:ABC transporter substrate-binding protein [Trueperella pyogenes]|uniref:ABC transporter substrate-binding protein n=1 Tax=Trueperella pyogenes TaxID=1661 RepID=UPI00215D2FB9|nr:extracellular solute-binding protein [Trueperella pyogenes]UVJ56112.1 extracellular solute-binding protein [Trueperella pyogenes]UVJ60127.1 extracellular solute-binding protein [Trueperella pyogenes]
MNRLLRVAATAIAFALAAVSLAGCSTHSREDIRFTFSKREAIDFMQNVVNEYNSSQDRYNVKLDTSGVDVVSASFVRGNPPDLMLANYNFEVARFVERCALSDLSDTAAAKAADLATFGPLMAQYGKCAGQISALPYSIMSSAVIYNKDIFAEHGLTVPHTWSELLDVANRLRDAGIDPFYATFKDEWTVGQGWFDYAIGGSIDVGKFFDKLHEAGDRVGPQSAASFQDLAAPMEKMLKLSVYANRDAAARSYGDGNLAIAQGKAAMYLQGPWAFSEIAKSAPELNLGTFPLPMTEEPKDLAVRVNIDLALMVPADAKNPKGARDFLEYLYQPHIIHAYNASQLGFTPIVGAAAPEDPRVAGMIPYYDAGQIYQGPSVLIPKAIPVHNYAQAIIAEQNAQTYLATLDKDWSRLAYRQPKGD